MSETAVTHDRLEWSNILKRINAPEHIYVAVRDLLDEIDMQKTQLTQYKAVEAAAQGYIGECEKGYPNPDKGEHFYQLLKELVSDD